MTSNKHNYSDNPFCYKCGRRIHTTRERCKITIDERIFYIHKSCKDKLTTSHDT